MTDDLPFGPWLMQRRKALNLTQEGLAELVGCAPQTIRKLESGERRPSREVAARLAAKFHFADQEAERFVHAARLHGTPQPTAITSAVPSSQRRSLPSSLTPLLGRERTVAEVCRLVQQDDLRLLTLLGPPGIGKTRLSLQAAAELQDHFDDGACFVPLAVISDPHLVSSSIAQALGVKELGRQPLLETLQAYLGTTHLLLVLDNFEHLVPAAPVVTQLLQAAPRLTVLATSRTPLRIYGEHAYDVPALSVPDPQAAPSADVAQQASAVQLFVARAQAVHTGFRLTAENASTIGAICRQLDGLPLAIELATAWIKLLPPHALLERLRTRLGLLTGGPSDQPQRHQSLHAAIDWSYDLLRAREQCLFRRLGIFVDGWTLDAADAVCRFEMDGTMDVFEDLHSLIAKSLVRPMVASTADRSPRFTMLETIRAYAGERLHTYGEADMLRRRHAAYYLALAEAVAPEIQGSQQLAWLEQLAADYGNLRAALSWTLAAPPLAPDAPNLGLRLAAALRWFWFFRGQLSEGRAWLAGALGGARDEEAAIERTGRLRTRSQETEARELALAQCLAGAGQLAWVQKDLASAAALCSQGLTRFRRLGNMPGIVYALTWLSLITVELGDTSAARAHADESVAFARTLGDPAAQAMAIFGRGMVAYAEQAYTVAQDTFAESLSLAQRTDNTWLIASSHNRLGMVAYHHGRYAQAARQLTESLRLFVALGHQERINFALVGLANVAVAHGDVDTAARLYGAAEALRDRIGAPLPGFEQDAYDRAVTRARRQMDTATWTGAWAEGRALPLEHTIKTVLAYGVTVQQRGNSPSVSRASARATAQQRPPASLSDRELEVLRLVAQGLSDNEVATRLVISPRTVHRHLTSIYAKLDVPSRFAATRYAIDHGLV